MFQHISSQVIRLAARVRRLAIHTKRELPRNIVEVSLLSSAQVLDQFFAAIQIRNLIGVKDGTCRVRLRKLRNSLFTVTCLNVVLSLSSELWPEFKRSSEKKTAKYFGHGLVFPINMGETAHCL